MPEPIIHPTMIEIPLKSVSDLAKPRFSLSPDLPFAAMESSVADLSGSFSMSV